MVHRTQLECFLELARFRSIQAAARDSGRSRATYLRALEDLRDHFDTGPLLQRAPGQRRGVLTPQGQELERRVRLFLQYWDQWTVSTRDALSADARTVRVGALAGSIDLLADALEALRIQIPDVRIKLVESPDEQLMDAVAQGVVDLGFGTRASEIPSRIRFDAFGDLPWAVILPRPDAKRFPARIRLRDLDGVPLVVTRAGTARRSLARVFAEHPSGPLAFVPSYEVGSSPRVVEMVARGFGPAVVSRFRLSFLPRDVVARPLVDGPKPLQAGVYVRKGATLSEPTRALVDRARASFDDWASS